MKKLITSAYKAQALTSLSVIVAFGAGFTFEPSNLNALNKPEEITKLFDVTGGDKNTSDSSENQKTWTDLLSIPRSELDPLVNEFKDSADKLSTNLEAFEKKVKDGEKEDLTRLEVKRKEELERVEAEIEEAKQKGISSFDIRVKGTNARFNIRTKAIDARFNIKRIRSKALNKASTEHDKSLNKVNEKLVSSVKKLSSPSLSIAESGSNLTENKNTG